MYKPKALARSAITRKTIEIISKRLYPVKIVKSGGMRSIEDRNSRMKRKTDAFGHLRATEADQMLKAAHFRRMEKVRI